MEEKCIHHDVLLWDKEIPPSDLTNYSGPGMGFPCLTTIHMKNTLNLTYPYQSVGKIRNEQPHTVRMLATS